MNGNENDALEQSENESIPEGVQEELDSQAKNPQTPAQNPVSMVLDTAGKEAVVSGSKKAIAMLLKKKFLFVALIAGGALILIIILFAVMDSSGVDDYIFQEPLCETVTVHYDPYGPGEEETFTMDLEDYVKSAVYAYTRDLTTSTASTYHLYFSLSVALRNEAMTHDCEVTYRDMEIPRTVGEVDYYFDTAIENSYGIAMVDENEEFIETTVSSFCWNSQGTVTDIFEEEMPGYTLYQPGGMGVPNDFVAPYFDNPVYQNCECNLDTGVETITEREYNNQDQCYMYWYTEEELEDGSIQYHYYREYQHQDHADPVGYSLYAANYLLRTGSNYTQILKYFYGEDILLRTTQEENTEPDGDWNSFNNSSCMWWPIGSNETTRVDGSLVANGTPATVRITSDYGPRDAPTATASSYHYAIDIGGGVEGQTNIIAAASGTVVAANNVCVAGHSECGGRLGNYVRIMHSDGTITRYGHMQDVYVNVGDNVIQGQVIGTMGNTGDSTGPHLDFQVLVNGEAVNPLDYVDPSNPRKLCVPIIANGEGDQQTVCLNLLSYGSGYSINALTGILANIQAESGFNPQALNSSSGAYGLVQWLGGRKTGVMNACGASSSNEEYISCQVSYIFQELSSSERNANSYLLRDASASDMAYYFCQYYERPEEGVCSSGTRQGYANDLLPYVTNGCQ